MKYLRSYINLPAILGVIFFALGALSLLTTLAQNATFGESIADSSRGQMISITGSLIMDCFTAALAMALGAFLCWRRYGIAALSGVALLLYLAYSMQSSFGFSMNERMAKAERLRDVAGEARRAAEADNTAVLAARAALVGDYRSRIAEANAIAGDRKQPTARRNEARAEKKRLDQALLLLSNAPPLLKQLPPRPEAILADPQAEILARWTGLDAEVVAAMQISALAIGLPLGKVLGFFLGGICLHLAGQRGRERLAEIETALKPASLPTAANDDVAIPVTPVRSDAEVMADIERSMDEALEIAALEDRSQRIDTIEDEDRVSRAVEDIMDKQQRQINDLQAYLATATDIAPTVQVSAKQFMDHYQSWARNTDRIPAISNKIDLGNLLMAAGLGRMQERSRVYYTGRSLRPIHTTAVEEVGLAEAA